MVENKNKTKNAVERERKPNNNNNNKKTKKIQQMENIRNINSHQFNLVNLKLKTRRSIGNI